MYLWQRWLHTQCGVALFQLIKIIPVLHIFGLKVYFVPAIPFEGGTCGGRECSCVCIYPALLPLHLN